MRRRAFLQSGLAATAAAAAGTLLPGRTGEAVPGRWAVRHQDDVLRLNSNENALGPSEAARRAVVEGLGEGNRYTHPVVAEFRPRLAAHLAVAEDALILGNGSTEFLRMAVATTAAAGGRIVQADPTFEHVARYAEPFGLEVEGVPLTADFAHDLGRMRDLVDQRPGPVLVYICNPNNPTGSLTPSSEVEAWIRDARDDVLFLVDEAYLEYVEDSRYSSTLPLALESGNTLVVRTFSKIYGLAGLRIGYGLAHPELARRVGAFTGFSNLNQAGLRAAGACLGDDDWLNHSAAANREARRITEAVLDELGLERIPGHTNFLMHRVPGDVESYIRRMRQAGAWVGRPFPPMHRWNRLSFGLPEEMERFANLLRRAREEGWV